MVVELTLADIEQHKSDCYELILICSGNPFTAFDLATKMMDRFERTFGG